MPRYLVGIDLGTTNTALAYVDLQRKPAPAGPMLQTFPVPQLVGPGETAPRELLPSFLYLPGPHDLPPGAVALPWEPGAAEIIGEFARAHGARVPGRLVTSAKSWLCHAGVDRSAPLLPWGAPPDVPRLSPVEVSAKYLNHLARAWDYAVAKGNAEDALEKQTVVLTVPASFDDVARNLTVEAARRAGLGNVTLLEEPQAAFYCWLAIRAAAEVGRLQPGSRCLVIDVGGGTSDFSLIEAREQEGELGFMRLAVGDHLLLGGDNMDLALAKLAETRLPQAGRLDATQFSMLTQACRAAKEALLKPDAPDSYPVTVVGRGRQVVGGALHTRLTPAEVRSALFDGFFPVAALDAEPARGRAGLHEMGLPFVSDPAITKHLAAFLRNHGDRPPDAVLFNGGVFQPAALRDRLIEVMHGWFDRPGANWSPLVLTNPSLDLAVAWGAARYGWLRHTGGRRIGGGMARSYYLGVDVSDGSGEATAGPDGATVLCVVSQQLEEGEEVALPKPELELALGQPVSFPLFTSTVRGGDQPGQVLHARRGQLRELPPLHTVLRGGKRSGTKRVPVTLAARCTEIGTLELWCVAREGGNRWRLEFNVRDVVSSPEDDGEPEAGAPIDVWPEVQVQEAGRLIRDAYTGSGDPRELTRDLESALGESRGQWPTGLCRRLWEFLAEVAEQRRRSPAHLSRWYWLVGFSLRPGMGDPLDRHRVEQLWKLTQAPHRTAPGPAGRTAEGGADFWVMWRRVSAGLSAQHQYALAERLRPVLLPTKSKGAIKPGANELAEMWRAAASLERLDVKQKEALGDALVRQIRRSPAPVYAFWSLTRLGARRLLYGPLNAVTHPSVGGRWLDAIHGFDPGSEGERHAWAFCIAQIARRSGQRALDIDDDVRERVSAALKSANAPGDLTHMVEDYVEPEKDERSQMFGESLPIGLRLASAAT